ncbi:hypothetical protein GA565_19100 [Rouxiella sp. S1S-2]|uniref:hypothetical protein n=1 Tax=Rouxiella sp. S1S-2 TaxID=2653856 RepID=UPI00126460CC|nr:hypothetical protein [Rouxiella sp. S1S-2]KAB7897918.1 hypothetical protein GA565_19100 [Rouxiella sp. S1S-2]
MIPLNSLSRKAKTVFKEFPIIPGSVQKHISNLLKIIDVKPSSDVIKSNEQINNLPESIFHDYEVPPSYEPTFPRGRKLPTPPATPLLSRSPSISSFLSLSNLSPPEHLRPQIPPVDYDSGNETGKSELADKYTGTKTIPNNPINPKNDLSSPTSRMASSLNEGQINQPRRRKVKRQAPLPPTLKLVQQEKKGPQVPTEQKGLVKPAIAPKPQDIFTLQINSEPKNVPEPIYSQIPEHVYAQIKRKFHSPRPQKPETDHYSTIDDLEPSAVPKTKPLNSYEKIKAQALENLLKDLRIPKKFLDLKNQVLCLDPVFNEDHWHALIDSLFTCACGGKGYDLTEAKKAETFLFELYTGRVDCKNLQETQAQLVDKSLDMFEKIQYQNAYVQNRNDSKTELPDDHPDKPLEILWEIPAKLLLMAGFQPTQEQDIDVKEEIAHRLNRSTNLKTYLNDNNSDLDKSFLENNRFIQAAELNAVASHLNNERGDSVRFHDALSPLTDGSEHVIDRHTIDTFTKTFKTNFAPILLEQHWYLFGTIKNEDNTRSALVFDSKNGGKDREVAQEYFSSLATACGVTGGPEFISEDLQKNAPNACGLFVAKAMEALTEVKNKKYAEKLKERVQHFQQQSVGYQQAFNWRGRAELFDTLNENIILQK